MVLVFFFSQFPNRVGKLQLTKLLPVERHWPGIRREVCMEPPRDMEIVENEIECVPVG